VIEGLDNDLSSAVKGLPVTGCRYLTALAMARYGMANTKAKSCLPEPIIIFVAAKNGTQKFSGSLTIIY
jgi:hypothetical protein